MSILQNCFSIWHQSQPGFPLYFRCAPVLCHSKSCMDHKFSQCCVVIVMEWKCSNHHHCHISPSLEERELVTSLSLSFRACGYDFCYCTSSSNAHKEGKELLSLGQFQMTQDMASERDSWLFWFERLSWTQFCFFPSGAAPWGYTNCSSLRNSWLTHSRSANRIWIHTYGRKQQETLFPTWENR